jgi:molybdopterin synthase sulfur carrier subunit
MLRVLLFGRLGDVAGDTEIGIPWDDRMATIETVREQVIRTIPELAESLGEQRNLVAVNRQICGTEAEVNDGDEIAFMPPVTGG